LNVVSFVDWPIATVAAEILAVENVGRFRGKWLRESDSQPVMDYESAKTAPEVATSPVFNCSFGTIVPDPALVGMPRDRRSRVGDLPAG